jgi:hypothetical protein
LREEDFGPYFGLVSELVHASNPYASRRDVATDTHRLRTLVKLLMALLNHHTIVLAGGDQMIAAMMNESTSGAPRAFLFAKGDPHTNE